MELNEGRIEMAAAEHEAVEKLRSENPDASISLTRRDAGESGPLLVHAAEDTYEVTEDGKRKKVT